MNNVKDTEGECEDVIATLFMTHPIKTSVQFMIIYIFWEFNTGPHIQIGQLLVFHFGFHKNNMVSKPYIASF